MVEMAGRYAQRAAPEGSSWAKTAIVFLPRYLNFG
jgi:hypothetical protein